MFSRLLNCLGISTLLYFVCGTRLLYQTQRRFMILVRPVNITKKYFTAMLREAVLLLCKNYGVNPEFVKCACNKKKH
jgi:hypothetical protein